jgi:hypothetical protein
MNSITITLPTVEAKLDRIIELLEQFTTHDCSKCTESVVKYVASELGQTEQAEPQKEEIPGQEVLVDTPAPEKPVVKLADVQKKVVDLSTAGKKDAVKAVIQAYAPRVSAIPEDKLAEVLEKLTALEG